MVSTIEQLGTIELADMAIAMPLNSEIAPLVPPHYQNFSRGLLLAKARNFGKRRFYTQIFRSKPIKIQSCDIDNV
jgi:hypothetical protein